MNKLHYDEIKLIESSDNWEQESFQLSEFDQKLRSGWDKAQDDGHFRYILDIEDTNIIGEKKYVAQLNVLRATERRKPDEINTVNQPFNPAGFNFTKIKQAEILFEMVKDVECVDGENSAGDSVCNGKLEKEERNLVIINVSPLEYGHVLLVPDIDAYRPQILTEAAIKFSIETMLLSKHRGFRVGFNSLCAFASVNHQHLHAYYLDRELFVEFSPVEHLCGSLYELTTMPVKGFAFQLHGSTVDNLSSVVFQVADYCQRNEIAHNVFMTRGPVFNDDRHSNNRTVRLYFWPRRKFIGLKDEAAFNVAMVELAGHLPVKVKDLFHSLTEKMIEDTMLEAALDEPEYNSIKQDVMKICQKHSNIV